MDAVAGVELLTNLTKIIETLWTVTLRFLGLTGLIMLFLGVYKLSRTSSGTNIGNQSEGQKIIGLILGGTLLLSIQPFVNSFSQQAFNADAKFSLSQVQAGGGGEMIDLAIRFAFYAIMYIGLIAIGKGLWGLGHLGESQDYTVPKSISFVFFGILAMNIEIVVNIVAALGGSQFESALHRIIGA